jgi:hypothetical protein
MVLFLFDVCAYAVGISAVCLLIMGIGSFREGYNVCYVKQKVVTRFSIGFKIVTGIACNGMRRDI